MALSEQQEKDLLAAIPALQKQVGDLAPLAAKVPELEKTLAAKDAQIAELQKGQTNLTQETAFQALKSMYPDVPEHLTKHALGLPADQREGFLKPVQDQLSKVKAPQAETDPLKVWANAGGVGPTSEAERVAMEKKRNEEYNENQSRGNVTGMLHSRSSEIISKLLAPALRK